MTTALTTIWLIGIVPFCAWLHSTYTIRPLSNRDLITIALASLFWPVTLVACLLFLIFILLLFR